ncbi:MAG: ferrochelatase, partial [bacterium]
MEINKAVLLVNLGTPEQPTPGAVSVFLTKFLSDPRVVEAPRWIWWFVLRCIVIPLRKRRVAAAYQSIWTDEGSPLRVISEKQRIALQQSLQDRGVKADVFTAETYGGEPLGEAIKRISERGYQRTLLIPMYPQYSGSTTGAIYDQVAKLTQNSRDIPDVRIIKDFHDNPLYIEALAESIVEFRAAHGENRKLLMSFHGVPKDYVDKGDPYYHQCKRTAQLVADRMQLPEDAWDFCFQSRFGPKEWLQPYTDVY